MWIGDEFVVFYSASWIARHQERLRLWEEAIGEHIVVNWEGLRPCGRPINKPNPNRPAVVMRKHDYYELRKNFE